MAQGRFAEALDALKRGHELGSRRPGWGYPSGDWVRQCEQLVDLNARLNQILRGEIPPAGAAGRLALARVCQAHKNRYTAAAAGYYAEAFAAEQELAEDPKTQNRYNAACAAALAGCGRGEGAARLDDAERARLRRQALTWLRADLTAWRQLLEKEPGKARASVLRALRNWQQLPDLAGVRGDALAQLPEAERQTWQQLWADVEQVLRKADDPGT
jgi:serine/threonine-protein kinase